MRIFRIEHILLILYYLFLFVLETPLFFNVGVPSATIRLVYLVLLILPICIYDNAYLPIVVFAAHSISKFGTAVTLMPTEVWYYPPILFLLLFALREKKSHSQSIPIQVIILCGLILIVDLLTGQQIHNVFYCLLILVLLFFYCFNHDNREVYLKVYSHMFVVVSIILSLELIFAGSQFVENYGYTDMERTVWADPNYLGGVIGMGVIAASILLTRKSSLLIKIYLAAVIMVMVFALVRNASRGALLAAISGIVMLLFGRGFKTWQKIVFLFLAIAFVVVLYNNSFFDLLEYRFENESGGGSGRIGIWKIKWEAFLHDSSTIQMIFGRGYDGGMFTGFSYGRAFHNDFLAFLVDYGVIGFVAFLSLFFYPLKGASLKNSAILACVAFLFVNCMTLEPFSLGVPIFYCFWIYAFLLASSSRAHAEFY